MSIVRTAADLRAARATPAGDDRVVGRRRLPRGRIERLDEAHQRWQLRHLQLTHYRPNELGDIQTEPSVHGGLTGVRRRRDPPLQQPRHRRRRGTRHVRAGEEGGRRRDPAIGPVAHFAQRPADAVDAPDHVGPRARHRRDPRRHRHLARDPERYRQVLRRQHRPHGRCRRRRPCRDRHRPARPAGGERAAELRRPAAARGRAVAALQAGRDRQAARRQLPPRLRGVCGLARGIVVHLLGARHWSGAVQ